DDWCTHAVIPRTQTTQRPAGRQLVSIRFRAPGQLEADRGHSHCRPHQPDDRPSWESGGVTPYWNEGQLARSGSASQPEVGQGDKAEKNRRGEENRPTARAVFLGVRFGLERQTDAQTNLLLLELAALGNSAVAVELIAGLGVVQGGADRQVVDALVPQHGQFAVRIDLVLEVHGVTV